MSDSEADTKTVENNDDIPDNVPDSDPDMWKAMAAAGAELGAAVSSPSGLDDAGDIDLDQLNDNILHGAAGAFDDNLSLEVNFGDGSSCRASDDRRSDQDAQGVISASTDDTREAETPSDAGDTTPTASETLHSTSSNGNQSDASQDALTPTSTSGGLVQKRNSLEIRNNIPNVKEVKKYVGTDHVAEKPRLQGGSTPGAVPKIRKKSPGLARRLGADVLPLPDRDSSSSERESEPALIDTTVRSAQKDFETKLRQQTSQVMSPKPSHADQHSDTSVEASSENRPKNGISINGKSDSFEKLCDSLLGNDSNSYVPPSSDCNTSPEEGEGHGEGEGEGQVKGMEIENEYDYIKYARIQHGDSYVGMRLAYSSSGDSLSAKRNNWNTCLGVGARASDDEYLGSSSDGSPEKTSASARQNRIGTDQIHVSKVNEDTLTEIPLNSADTDRLGADTVDRNFSLSPEATECDSADVESVISEDEGKSSTSGMPIVEDGLSSSQGSDAEDGAQVSAPEQTPAEILRRRYKAEIDNELQGGTGSDAGDHHDDECAVVENPGSAQSTPSHASSASLGDQHRSKEVDMAIKDIKSAIERSKQTARQRAAQANDETNSQEPVWVMRDSYVKKLAHHNDLQHVRDEYQRHQEEESNRQKQEQDFQGDEDEDGMKYPYHNDAKTFPSNKGFDSDDDDDIDRAFYERGRQVKGKQYKPLPSNEPISYRHSCQDVRSHGNDASQPANQSAAPSRQHSRSEASLNRSGGAGVHALMNSASQGALRMSDPVPKPVRSFSSTLPNSRYQTVQTAQYSLTPSSQSATCPRPAPGPAAARAPDAASLQQASGSPYSQLPASTPVVMPNAAAAAAGGSSNPERSPADPASRPRDAGSGSNEPRGGPREADGGRYTAPERTEAPTSKEPPEEEDQPRHQRSRRRCPSYEYHDDSEDDYCYDDDGSRTAYIRDRDHGDYDTDEETDELLDKQYTRSEKVDIPELSRPPVNRSAQVEKRRTRVREVTLRDPENETVLIEGVLFRARYLGSTQLLSDGQPSKALRMMQAQEAVGRIKAPEGESQPSTEVDLFVSIEKIMVLNTDLQEIMMDHALRTISYIADIGDILVIMARRGPVMSPGSEGGVAKRKNKICCHVFETEEAQLIAQSIGQAFQVAYMEFLKANGIEDPGMLKEIDYQDVLNQQEIFGEELFLFSNKEMQKEVIVPKLKNEPLGVVIVESGWGSMVPTVVLANMSPNGAAARCGQLNIGDQIMSINGVSLVGIPLSSCQTYIKACRNQTAVKLNVVSCAPVVEVCIKRPDVKYQLGFSVQNGVICSLLRGGIAERGGVRVGHRIIEINGESVVAVPHEKIVKMLATSVGEIHMKTMPTSIFRLLTGQDTPHYI